MTLTIEETPFLELIPLIQSRELDKFLKGSWSKKKGNTFPKHYFKNFKSTTKGEGNKSFYKTSTQW